MFTMAFSWRPDLEGGMHTGREKAVRNSGGHGLSEAEYKAAAAFLCQQEGIAVEKEYCPSCNSDA